MTTKPKPSIKRDDLINKTLAGIEENEVFQLAVQYAIYILRAAVVDTGRILEVLRFLKGEIDVVPNKLGELHFTRLNNNTLFIASHSHLTFTTCDVTFISGNGVIILKVFAANRNQQGISANIDITNTSISGVIATEVNNICLHNNKYIYDRINTLIENCRYNVCLQYVSGGRIPNPDAILDNLSKNM